MLIRMLLIGAGGFAGAILRYGMAGAVQRLFPATTFPWGTLAVNLLGCLVIGVATGLADSRQVLTAEARMFLLIGVLGAFTTYSTFGYETFALLRDAEHMRALLNVLAHVLVGLACVWLGYVLAAWG